MTALSKYRLHLFKKNGYMYKKILTKQNLEFGLLKTIKFKTRGKDYILISTDRFHLG